MALPYPATQIALSAVPPAPRTSTWFLFPPRVLLLKSQKKLQIYARQFVEAKTSVSTCRVTNSGS